MSDTVTDVIARAQLKRLRGTGIDIDSDAIIDNYCEVEFKDYLDGCETESERKKAKKKMVEYYKSGDGKAFMDDAIDKIKDYVSKTTDGIKQLTTSAAKTTAMSVVPAVVTVGSATSSPNPEYIVLDNSQKKSTLMTIVKTINGYLLEIFQLAILIHWDIPDEVISLTQGLTTLVNVIDAI